MATSVSGAVILTSIIVCVFLRYRRKRKENRDGRSPTPDGKEYNKPVAVRGSVSGSRLNSLEKLKLPNFSPYSAKKEEPLNFGFAISDYSDQKEKSADEVQSPEQVKVGNSASSFRLQKPPSVQSAEAVRVIRVNSKKEKEQPFTQPVEPSPPVPEPPQPMPSKSSFELDRSQSQSARKPLAAAPLPADQPVEEKRRPANSVAPVEETRESKRFTMISEASGKNRASSRYTMISTATVDPPQEDNKRYTMASQTDVHEEPGWRPPSAHGNSRANSIKTINTAQRLAFRDSGDPVPEPDATGWKQPKGGFSMAGVSSLMRSDSANIDNRQPTIPKLPKAPRQGPSFTTFPTVRSGPPSSILNRPRPAPVGKTSEDAEHRLKGKEREGSA